MGGIKEGGEQIRVVEEMEVRGIFLGREEVCPPVVLRDNNEIFCGGGGHGLIQNRGNFPISAVPLAAAIWGGESKQGLVGLEEEGEIVQIVASET